MSSGIRITGLSVSGFKSLVSPVSVDVGAITLFSGRSGSGKSAIMEPLLGLKRSLERATDIPALLFERPTENLVSSESGFVNLHISAGDRFLRMSFSLNAQGILQCAGSMYGDSNEVVVVGISDLQNVASDLHAPRLRIGDKWMPVEFEETIRGIIYVPNTTIQGRSKRVSLHPPYFSGIFQNSVAEIINRWGSNELSALNAILEQMELARGVSVVCRGNCEIDVLVTTSTGKRVGLSDAGEELPKVLPAIVALMVASPNQIVYLEHPDAGLHPHTAAVLTDVMVHSAARGSVLIVESKSEIILLGVQKAVASGVLSPQEVKLHWFSLNNGRTTVDTAILDDEGAWGEWPTDVGEAVMEAMDAYLDAVSSRRQSKGQKEK